MVLTVGGSAAILAWISMATAVRSMTASGPAALTAPITVDNSAVGVEETCSNYAAKKTELLKVNAVITPPFSIITETASSTLTLVSVL